MTIGVCSILKNVNWPERIFHHSYMGRYKIDIVFTVEHFSDVCLLSICRQTSKSHSVPSKPLIQRLSAHCIISLHSKFFLS